MLTQLSCPQSLHLILFGRITNTILMIYNDRGGTGSEMEQRDKIGSKEHHSPWCLTMAISANKDEAFQQLQVARFNSRPD